LPPKGHYNLETFSPYMKAPHQPGGLVPLRFLNKPKKFPQPYEKRSQIPE